MKRDAAIWFVVVLAAIMLGPRVFATTPPPPVTFYMTLPAPTAARPIGPLPLPTATTRRPPTATPTVKTCTVFDGKWIGPCLP